MEAEPMEVSEEAPPAPPSEPAAPEAAAEAAPAAPAPPPGPPAPPPVLNPEASAQVLQLLAAGNFSSLVAACEELELTALAELFDSSTPPNPDQVDEVGVLYAVHLLAYLLEGNLDAARFLWKRTPSAVQQQTQAAAAHEALASCWRRQYDQYFSWLAPSVPWDARLQPLAAEVVSRSRSKVLDRVANAYKVIAAGRIAAMLGLDEAAARTACEARGWAVAADGTVTPIPVKSEDDLMQMGEAQLQKLAEYVSHLEQPPCRI
eukprot:TRINITY_DN20976_c0_g1_i1.p1 TRINITY_DN20976_c0_g1~~TRINITY_DN20976_c0_g1_i1.p1  ORF type:complete len:262 (+),score=83.50 TRINITY_DN20976_c0_g1_i1:119-904(+)